MHSAEINASHLGAGALAPPAPRRPPPPHAPKRGPLCVHTGMRTRARTHVHTQACRDTHACTLTRTHMHTHTHRLTQAHAHAHTHSCTDSHAHTHAHTRTHLAVLCCRCRAVPVPPEWTHCSHCFHAAQGSVLSRPPGHLLPGPGCPHHLCLDPKGSSVSPAQLSPSAVRELRAGTRSPAPFGGLLLSISEAWRRSRPPEPTAPRGARAAPQPPSCPCPLPTHGLASRPTRLLVRPTPHPDSADGPSGLD